MAPLVGPTKLETLAQQNLHPVCAGSSGLTRLSTLQRFQKLLACCSLAAGRPRLARVLQPDRARSGTEPLAASGAPASATAVTGDERRAPWIPCALKFPHSHISPLLFDSKRLPCYGFDLTTIRSGSPQTMRRHRGPWSSPPRSSPSPSASAAASSTSAFPTRQVALTLLY